MRNLRSEAGGIVFEMSLLIGLSLLGIWGFSYVMDVTGDKYNEMQVKSALGSAADEINNVTSQFDAKYPGSELDYSIVKREGVDYLLLAKTEAGQKEISTALEPWIDGNSTVYFEVDADQTTVAVRAHLYYKDEYVLSGRWSTNAPGEYIIDGHSGIRFE